MKRDVFWLTASVWRTGGGRVCLIDSVWFFVFLLLLSESDALDSMLISAALWCDINRINERSAEGAAVPSDGVCFLVLCWFVHCPVRKSQLAAVLLASVSGFMICYLWPSSALSFRGCRYKFVLSWALGLFEDGRSSSAFVPICVLIRWETWWNCPLDWSLWHACHRKQERSNYHLW